MKLLVKLLLLAVMPLGAQVQIIEDEQWSWVYKDIFTQQEMENNAKHDALFFSQTDLEPFTQLILSWNGQRPEDSYFTFYVQVRDAATKQWYDYHTVADWGTTIQRSHFNRTAGSAFYYVRLEMENNGNKADGFRVKVKGQRPHDLGLIKALIVSTADFARFKAQTAAATNGLKSFVLRGVPRTSQILIDHPRGEELSYVLCSPTSTSMVVGALKKYTIDPIAFADYVYDSGLNIFGNWSFNTAHAYELCNEQILFYPARLASFEALYNLVRQKIPVVVSIHGPLKDAPRPYAKGHLLVVIGFDAAKKEVICHDPAFDSNEAVYARYDVQEFIKAWERSRRLAYKPQLVR